MRNMVADYRLILCIGALGSFLSYFLTLTPSENCFAEMPATVISELGCHVGIYF